MDYMTVLNGLLLVLIASTMLDLGMTMTVADLSASLRSWGPVIRVCLAAFAVSAGLAWLVVQAVNVPLAAGGALLLLMCVPPGATITKYAAMAGADEVFALALLVVLSMAGMVITPFLAQLVLPVKGPLTIDPTPIALLLLVVVAAPFIAGLMLSKYTPAVAKRLKPWAVQVSNIALIAVLILVLWQEYATVLSLGVGVLGLLVATWLGAGVIGWVLTGSPADKRFIGALACASRHPGIALLIVNANFPAERIGEDNMSLVLATLVAYSLINMCFGLPVALAFGRRPQSVA